MTIDLSTDLETALSNLAGQQGRDINTVVEEAIRQYLDATAITDVEPDDVGETQMKLVGELSGAPTWSNPQEPAGDETR